MAEEQDREAQGYEKLAAKAKEIFEDSKEKTVETFDKAVKTARERLEAAGELGKEEAEQLAGYLRRDIKAAMSQTEGLGDRLKESLDPGRLGSAFLGLTSTVLTTTGGAFSAWAQKADEALVFRTGEITGPGTLTCKNCGNEMHIKGTKRIPPCGKCHKTDFRKSY